MADARYEILEFRAVVKPHWTELYVLCGPASDGTLGVQGWHKKIIEPGIPALDALREALVSSSYLLWPFDAPESRTA